MSQFPFNEHNSQFEKKFFIDQSIVYFVGR